MMEISTPTNKKRKEYFHIKMKFNNTKPE
jgi:hypothetical protein